LGVAVFAVLLVSIPAALSAQAREAIPSDFESRVNDPNIPASEVLTQPEGFVPGPLADKSAPVRDSGGPMGGNGPGGLMGNAGSAPGYDAAWYPTRSVTGQDADLGFVRQGLSLGVPIWRHGGDMLMARVGVRHTLFQTDALRPDSQRPFPDQLWNLTFGLNYMHRFENGWTGMLMGGFGSASDKPFDSIREVTANVGGIVRLPARNGRDNWQLGAMYMAGGPVNFPLPIIAYGYTPSDRLRVNIGLPLSVDWQPTDDWTLNLSYMPLYNINARLTYQMAPRIWLYGGYEFLNESYLLADRTNTTDRFFSLEQRLVTGLRWHVGTMGALELNGGYSFGRSYGEGESQWSRLQDRLDVRPGPFLGIHFRIRY
jgi:hypothetical protein